MSDEVKKLLDGERTDVALRTALEAARASGATAEERKKLAATLVAATGNSKIGGEAPRAAVVSIKARTASRLRSIARITRTTVGLAAAIFVVVVVLRHLPKDDQAAQDAAATLQAHAENAPSDDVTGISKMPTEAELLAHARASLASAPAQAFEILEAHRRDHPRGTLSEERDALRVEALVALGRRSDAQMNGELFLRQYPSSVHASRVRGALAQ